jgi:predicted deacetylase
MGPVRLLVSLSGLGPGAPLAAAVECSDALDARRVPLTLLVGPCPHPEVAAFAAARRRAGDAVLLRGTREAHDGGRPYRRLPVLEARLGLAGAMRSAELLGLEVDGFAAPGWSVSDGTRRALAEAGLGLLLDDAGVHRLGPDGVPTAGVAGPVVRPGEPAPSFLAAARARRRPAEARLRHLTAEVSGGVDALVAAVDEALADGAVPTVPSGLVARARRPRRPVGGALDPELWSTTA